MSRVIQEERLIAQLQRVEGEAAGGVCARVAAALLAGGPASCLGARVHPRAAPAHTFARFLFLALLPQHADLAYRVGLRAMRYVNCLSEKITLIKCDSMF